MREISKSEKKDIRTLGKFIEVFCREKHEASKEWFSPERIGIGAMTGERLWLCPQCTALLKYALTMRLKCPYDPKPMCRKCTTQCYKAGYKEQVREVMRFSGMYLIKRGRINLLFHYLK